MASMRPRRIRRGKFVRSAVRTIPNCEGLASTPDLQTITAGWSALGLPVWLLEAALAAEAVEVQGSGLPVR